MFTKEQKAELKEANKKLLISGIAAGLLVCKMAQQQMIEVADDVVEYLREKEKKDKLERDRRK